MLQKYFMVCQQGSVLGPLLFLYISMISVEQYQKQSTPSRGPIPKPCHPWTRPNYDAKRHPDPIRRFSTMHWTDRRTDVPTDIQIVHGKV